MEEYKHPSILNTEYNLYRLKYLIDQGDSVADLVEKMEFSEDAIKKQIKRLGLKKPPQTHEWS